MCNNLFGRSFSFEAHFPENVVDQIDDVLVQEKHFLDIPALRRVSATHITNGLAHCETGMKKLRCSGVSGLSGYPMSQVQSAHINHAVSQDLQSLSVYRALLVRSR